MSDWKAINLPEEGGKLEAVLTRAAVLLVYPPTPDLAGRASLRLRFKHAATSRPGLVRQRFAWVFALVTTLALVLFFVEPVRARLIEWLRVGAVLIFPGESQPQPEFPIATPGSSLDLPGATTIRRAAQQAGFPLLLPEGMNEPQRVFYQEIDGTPIVILVWTDSQHSERAKMALYEIGEGNVFTKRGVETMEETTVDGSWALWLQGPHLLETSRGTREFQILVAGHTLLWSDGALTFRLETGLTLEEARRVAESLVPWNP